MKTTPFRIMRQSETQTVITDNYGVVISIKKTVQEAKAFVQNVLQHA